MRASLKTPDGAPAVEGQGAAADPLDRAARVAPQAKVRCANAARDPSRAWLIRMSASAMRTGRALQISASRLPRAILQRDDVLEQALARSRSLPQLAA